MNPEDPPTSHPLDPEKQPMAEFKEEEEEEEGGGEGGGAPQNPPNPPLSQGEKNGLVLKIPSEEGEEDEAPPHGRSPPPISSLGGKFTGLGKEELLLAASTPPWRKARTFLLFLFWGGWLGMVGAAAAIVARAPRCRPLPPSEWWHLGGVYRAPPLKQPGGGLAELNSQLELLGGLGARGLVVGTPPDPQGTPQAPPQLNQQDQELGELGAFQQLLKGAKKQGLKVFVDLTPDPQEGGSLWGGSTQDTQLQQRVEAALELWLDRGANGVFLDGIEELPTSLLLKWRNQTELKGQQGEPRVLVGGSRLRDPQKLQELLEVSGGPLGPGGLLLGHFIGSGGSPPPPEFIPQLLRFLHPQTPLGWSVGTVNPDLLPQQLLLIWTLPGTPVLPPGDQLLLDNSTQSLCRNLFALRSRERSLSLGDAEVVQAGSSVAAFLRHWDQSDRFLVLLNPGGQEVPVDLGGHNSSTPVPPELSLRLSTHRAPLSQVDREGLHLLPYEGLLLSFPYSP